MHSNWPQINADKRGSKRSFPICVHLRSSAAQEFPRAVSHASRRQPAPLCSLPSQRSPVNRKYMHHNWPQINADQRRSKRFFPICVHLRSSAAQEFPRAVSHASRRQPAPLRSLPSQRSPVLTFFSSLRLSVSAVKMKYTHNNWPQINADQRGSKKFSPICVHLRSSAAQEFPRAVSHAARRQPAALCSLPSQRSPVLTFFSSLRLCVSVVNPSPCGVSHAR